MSPETRRLRAEDVHGDFRLHELVGQYLLNGLLGFLDRQTGYIGLAIQTQADRAVGSNQVVAANHLLAARLGQRHLGLWLAKAFVDAQMGLNRLRSVFQRQAQNLDLAVFDAQVNGAVGVN